MNMFSSFILMLLVTVTFPIFLALTDFDKNDKHPNYVKTSITYTLLFCLIPTMMFINSNYELIISDIEWQYKPLNFHKL